MEVPESTEQHEPAQPQQWPRGLALLSAVGVYTALLVVLAVIMWLNVPAFSDMKGWGLVLTLVISGVALTLVAGIVLIVGVSLMTDTMASVAPHNTSHGDVD